MGFAIWSAFIADFARFVALGTAGASERVSQPAGYSFGSALLCKAACPYFEAFEGTQHSVGH